MKMLLPVVIQVAKQFSMKRTKSSRSLILKFGGRGMNVWSTVKVSGARNQDPRESMVIACSGAAVFGARLGKGPVVTSSLLIASESSGVKSGGRQEEA